MEAAGNVGSGRHVEDLADAAGKSPAQGGVDGLHGWAFSVGGGGQIEKWGQNGAGRRDGKVKNETQSRSAQVVELGLTDGGHDGQDVSDFGNVVLDQVHLSLRFDEGDVHVDADGRAACR